LYFCMLNLAIPFLAYQILGKIGQFSWVSLPKNAPKKYQPYKRLTNTFSIKYD
jgi:hypothetical protein